MSTPEPISHEKLLEMVRVYEAALRRIIERANADSALQKSNEEQGRVTTNNEFGRVLLSEDLPELPPMR